MKSWMKTIGAAFIAAALAVAGVYTTYGPTAFAATTDNSTAVNAGAFTGGLSDCVTASGTSASTAEELTVTLPSGFSPRTVLFIADYDATNPNVTFWMTGMPALDTGLFVTGSSGVVAYYSPTGVAAIDTSTAGSIVVNSGIQTNSGSYLVWACR